MTAMLEGLPWEPLGRFNDGHAGFAASQGTKRSDGPSASSGLTRRGVIYEYVRGHPGTHVRGMAKDLGIATGDLQYHLAWLERHGHVKTIKNGFYRLVYPTMQFKEDQEVLLGVLSKETPREILLCLIQDERVTQGDLARTLGYSQPTISWHMERLVGLGIVRKGRGPSYEVAANKDDVLGFVKAYHAEVWRRWSGRLSGLLVTAPVKRADRGGSLERAS